MKAAQLPAIRGLRLTMNKQQVLQIYPKTVWRKPQLDLFGGGLEGVISKKSITNKTFAKNIDQIIVTFDDNKLVSVYYYYDDSLTWLTAEEFKDQIAKSLNISPDKWKTLSNDENSYSVLCADFDLIASIDSTGKSRLALYVDAISRLDDQDKKKKAFKP